MNDSKVSRIKIASFIILKKLKGLPISQNNFVDELTEITGLSRTICYYWVILFFGNHITHERKDVENPMPPLFYKTVKTKTFNEITDNEVYYVIYCGNWIFIKFEC